MWHILVHASASTSPTEISATMKSLGTEADPTTIRSWIPTDPADDASVPRHKKQFLAFARAIGIGRPDRELEALFKSIKALRTAHRVAGRRLTKVIRLAALGQLGFVTQMQVQREWGVQVAELVTATTIATVEAVYPL